MPADHDGDAPGRRGGRPEPGSEELLEVGPHRSGAERWGAQRWGAQLSARWADRLRRVPLPVRLVAAAVVFAAVALVAGRPASSPGPSSPGPSASGPSASGPASPAPGTTPPSASPAAQDVATVVFLAGRRGPLTDFVRSDSAPGACRLVRPGTSPQARLAAAVHRVLPGYRVRSVARILDQFTAMCALQLRARDNRGTTLVVQVAVAGPGAATASRTVTVAAPAPGRARVSVVSERTGRGWTVTVGAVGPARDLPPAATLLVLAGNPALLW